MNARTCKTWTPSDIIQIAPGYNAMKIRVTNPYIFNKSDIVVIDHAFPPLLGYIYDKTPDGELHIFPLNGFPTSSIFVATTIEFMGNDPAKLGVQIPNFEELLTTDTDNTTPSHPTEQKSKAPAVPGSGSGMHRTPLRDIRHRPRRVRTHTVHRDTFHPHSPYSPPYRGPTQLINNS